MAMDGLTGDNLTTCIASLYYKSLFNLTFTA